MRVANFWREKNCVIAATRAYLQLVMCTGRHAKCVGKIPLHHRMGILQSKILEQVLIRMRKMIKKIQLYS